MYEPVTPPKSLTDNEKLVLRALMSRRNNYGARAITRPAENMPRYLFERGIRNGDFQHFVGHAPNVLEWTLMVANALSEDRVPLAKQPPRPETVEEAIVQARKAFEDKFEADRVEAQEELDEAPEVFAQYRKDAVVVDGKVLDPWGASLTGPTRWWFDNLTPVMVWLVSYVVQSAIEDCAADNMHLWAINDREGSDPRKAAYESFQVGMTILDLDLRAHLGS